MEKAWLYERLCSERLLLVLQMSSKTSADEWETSADKWRWVKMNERRVHTSEDEWRWMRDQCRRVKTSQRQMRDEYRRVKTNERWVQTSADEWETSAILSFLNPKSPTVFILERTCNVRNNQLNNE